jgi:hypothetical protein
MLVRRKVILKKPGGRHAPGPNAERRTPIFSTMAWALPSREDASARPAAALAAAAASELGRAKPEAGERKDV